MSYHRLLAARKVGGRMREAGSLIDHRGPLVPWLEPLDVREHSAWLGHLETARSQRDALRRAA